MAEPEFVWMVSPPPECNGGKEGRTHCDTAFFDQDQINLDDSKMDVDLKRKKRQGNTIF